MRVRYKCRCGCEYEAESGEYKVNNDPKGWTTFLATIMVDEFKKEHESCNAQ
jgi:hypothetical protein